MAAADLIAQELAEINAAGELADRYKWAEDNKDYMSMKNAIRKKYKGLMKMSMMTIKTEMGSSSQRKQTKKEKIMWVHSAMKDAGDFAEAVGLLPEVFGPGKYGTSGVNSPVAASKILRASSARGSAWPRMANTTASSSTPLATSSRRASCTPR